MYYDFVDLKNGSTFIFPPRLVEGLAGASREDIAEVEQEAQHLADQQELQNDLRMIVGQLEDFSSRVKQGLQEAENAVKRDIVRALVKRVEIANETINVVFRVDPRPFDSCHARGLLHFCLER